MALSETEAMLREALRLSEERVELALDAADAGVFDCDLITGFVYGSARYRAILGLPDGPIDGAETAAMTHPDDLVYALTPWTVLPEVNGRMVWTARVRPRGSSEWRLIETRARVVRDASGRPIRLIGVMQDVTSASSQIEALRESQRRLAEAQRVAGIGSWSWDPVTNEIIWTDELYRIFDMERDGQRGPSFEEYLGKLRPDERQTVLSFIQQALSEGTTYYFEHSVVLRDGSLRRVRSHGGVLRDEHGAIVRLVGTGQDMTEQWALMERLQRSEARYALAVQGTSDGIWQFDMRTRVSEVSPRLLELLGRPHDDQWVSTEWVSTVVPEADLELLKEAARRHLAHDAPLDIELQLRAGARGMRWFRLRGRAVRDADGVPILLAGALSDVTEQRALQARLQHDSKMNALGTLAGGIAHDFNNLVAAMLGYAQLASDEVPANSTAASHLAQVIDAARRAREIVREILAFSRPDEPRRSAVDLSQLVDETVRLLRPTLPSGVRVAVVGTSTPHLVLGDAVQLQRVLINLCANSLDAVRGREGDVTLQVSSEVFDELTAPAHGIVPGPYVRLQVMDSGVGIAPDLLARVFDPFFTTKPVGEGTGLGLSVVHGIVMAAGGTVTVESVEQLGTTVNVWLPQIEARPPMSGPQTGGAGARRVVVIDDDPAVGRLLQMALQRARYDAHLFTSSPDAVEALVGRSVECDCIVTDFAMPELNGIDLLLRVREAGIGVPAIMVTGFADGASQEMRARAQVHAMMEKPIELRAFVEMVGVVLAAH